MKIFDTIIFFNESDFELRLNILNDVVDYFAINQDKYSNYIRPWN
jgi:hypothetical protein